MMRRARVALAALLALCLLLSAPALAQETLWWLHGDFDSVETDGYSLSGSVLEYQKIAYAGEISLYAAGYPAGSGVALLTPEESGGDLAYERMEAVSLGQTQAERWRYEDAGSRWDFLAVETGDFLMSVMIALPAEDAENLNAEVEALIASLSLESAAQDAAPMLTADLDGFVTLMDRIDGEGRMLACTLGDGSAVSATFLRGAADEADFFKRLDKMMDIAARSLKVKRNVITKLLNEGLYPYTKYYLGNFNNHFSTIGLVGMNEAGLNAKWIRADMTTEKCQEFSKKVLNHMRERLSDYQEQYGDLYNLEATPAESTSYRLAKHDVEQYPDIITASQGDTPYYTNSSHLPVSYTDDIFSALDIQDELQTLYTSGTVFHAFLGEKLPDWQAAANLVRKIAENYKLPYYTISPTYSVCKNHGYLTGEQFTCPECGESAEVYSRITGYYRPVQNWNAGKTQEYKERKEYNIGTSVLRHKGPLHPEAKPAQEPAVEEEICKASTGRRTILFTRENCPNCRIVYSYLDKAGLECEKIMAEENVELALSYGVKQAPTLVVVDGEHVEKFAGAGAIKNYLFK